MTTRIENALGKGRDARYDNATRITDADIGKLVARNDARGATHRLESVVDGDALTNCGHRMHPKDSRGHPLVIVSGNTPSCKLCLP